MNLHMCICHIEEFWKQAFPSTTITWSTFDSETSGQHKQRPTAYLLEKYQTLAIGIEEDLITYQSCIEELFLDSSSFFGKIINSKREHCMEITSTFSSVRLYSCQRDLSLDTKMRIGKCKVLSVLLFGVKDWTLTQALKKNIEAVEIWIYRRIQTM